MNINVRSRGRVRTEGQGTELLRTEEQLQGTEVDGTMEPEKENVNVCENYLYIFMEIFIKCLQLLDMSVSYAVFAWLSKLVADS